MPESNVLVQLLPAGVPVATFTDLAGNKVQMVELVDGAGNGNDVLGGLTETAPASDTASSGLNGRLQRLAQRLSSVIALLPTALGAGGGLKIDGSGTPVPITPTPSALAAAGVAPVSTSALAANLVVKASPGNLFSFEVAADSTLSAAAWWLMIFNATSAPSDGAVTPAKCYALPSGTTGFNGAFNIPVYFSAGIVIVVSTTGPFTKTASAHAFISGDAQ